MEEDNHKFKVKIVAIAKDEGAYIAEWIFHHLYFGFDAIDIYVNRTTDNTCSILDKISKIYPSIRFIDADWVGMIPESAAKHMQALIYSQAFIETKNNGEYTHILFIDIDEFWTPLNFSDSIHNCLASIPKHASIAFQSCNVIGTKKQFNGISREMDTYISSAVKSICKVTADIDVMLVHMPKFYENDKFEGYKLANGAYFKFIKNYNAQKSSNMDHQLLDISERGILKPFIVLHLAFRTEIEYISLLHRGNAFEEGKLKLNRKKGYVVSDIAQERIMFDKLAYAAYEESRDDFFNALNLEEELTVARSFVLSRAEKTIAAIPNELDNNFIDVKKIFKNITNPEILMHFKEYENRIQKTDKCREILKEFNEKTYENTIVLLNQIISLFEQCDDKKTAQNIENEYDLILKFIKRKNNNPMIGVRNIALYFEECSNIEQAYIIMKMANLMNPNGPLINNKIKAYKLSLK